MKPDGTDPYRLTNNSFNDQQPAWSPDGSKIVFTSERNGNLDIYVMNADGTGETRLTTNKGFDRYPAWSPDGSRIAFQSSRDGEESVYQMNVDGTHQTRFSFRPGSDLVPAWSPDGSRLAFTAYGAIYLINSDGSGQTLLTGNSFYYGEPVWSPDGSRIAFDSNRNGNRDLYVINADGTGETRLTNASGEHKFPDWSAWSPDGSQIAFSSARRCPFCLDLFVINADGTGETRLTSGSGNVWSIVWSSDGSRIFFSLTNDENRAEIHVINSDGTGQTRLASFPPPTTPLDLAWHPAVTGDSIVKLPPLSTTTVILPPVPIFKGRELLLVSGSVWRDDTVEFDKWHWIENGRPSRRQPGDYTLSMLNKDGAVLETVSFIVGFVMYVDPLGSFPIDPGGFVIALPYPEQLVTQITLSHGDQVIATSEPNSQLLRDAVARMPSQGFDQNPEERRTALQHEIDQLEKLIEQGELTAAASKLENNIKDKVEQWLNDYESDDILQSTKQEIVSLIDVVLSRLAK